MMASLDLFILSYERPEYLDACLRSVLNQTLRPQRIAVFDNGSQANMGEISRRWGSQGVEWYPADSNRPFLWNFLRATNAATSPFVMTLHDDDILDPRFLEIQFPLLIRNNASAVTNNSIGIDPHGAPISGALLGPSLLGQIDVFRSPTQIAKVYTTERCFVIGSALYRTEAIRRSPLGAEYVKVIDVVQLCELTRWGPIINNGSPYYRTRLHEGQASTEFPVGQLILKDEYLLSQLDRNSDDIRRVLNKRLTRLYLDRWAQDDRSLSALRRILSRESFVVDAGARFVASRLKRRLKHLIGKSA